MKILDRVTIYILKNLWPKYIVSKQIKKLKNLFFKEREIDQDNTFAAKVLQENEIENVIFNTNKEYAVNRMVIKSDFADSELVKIENTKKLDRIRKEEQELITSYNN